MGIPACLWRRTGEIYKGNREFAELVGVDVGRLRDVSVACSYLKDKLTKPFLYFRGRCAYMN